MKITLQGSNGKSLEVGQKKGEETTRTLQNTLDLGLTLQPDAETESLDLGGEINEPISLQLLERVGTIVAGGGATIEVNGNYVKSQFAASLNLKPGDDVGKFKKELTNFVASTVSDQLVRLFESNQNHLK